MRSAPKQFPQPVHFRPVGLAGEGGTQRLIQCLAAGAGRRVTSGGEGAEIVAGRSGAFARAVKNETPAACIASRVSLVITATG